MATVIRDYYDSLAKEGAPMKFTFFVCAGFYKPKPLQIFLRVLFVVLVLGTIWHIVSFFIYSEAVYIIRYGPIFFGSTYAMVSVLTIYKLQIAENFRREFDCWNLATGSVQIQKKIAKVSFWTNAFAAFNNLNAFVAGISLVLPDSNERNFHFVLKILEYYKENYMIPEFCTAIVYYSYKFIFVCVFFAMTVNSHRLIYFGNQIKFQLYLYLDFLGNLSQGYDTEDQNLFYNEDYQKTIKKRLKLCIKRHSTFVSYIHKSNKEIGVYVILFALTATMLGVAVLLIGFTGTLFFNYFQMLTCVILYFNTLFCAIEGSQIIEIETEKIRDAILSNAWYTWNDENKKTMSIFLTSTLKPLELLKFSDSFNVNYAWGLSILSRIYSMGSVFFNLRAYLTN